MGPIINSYNQTKAVYFKFNWITKQSLKHQPVELILDANFTNLTLKFSNSNNKSSELIKITPISLKNFTRNSQTHKLITTKLTINFF